MAANQNHFKLNVINQEGIIYYGDCEVLFAPGMKDTIAIMAYHTPMIMKLGEGPVAMRLDHKESVIANTKSGVLYVGENEVSVLVNS